MGAGYSSEAPPPSQFVWDPSISKTTPDWKTGKVSADPQYGFDLEGKRRKEKQPTATLEELKSAKVPLKFRTYCAHRYIDLQKCKKDNFPFLYKCHHAKHEWDQCTYEDLIIRMKDYERERRLLHRKQRKEAKAARSAGEAGDAYGI